MAIQSFFNGIAAYLSKITGMVCRLSPNFIDTPYLPAVVHTPLGTVIFLMRRLLSFV
jgi:hypothetical protein